jgi:hypothetical protein
MKPRIYKVAGWWYCVQILADRGLAGVRCIGRGRSVKTAWKDFGRKYNWYKRGCPGLRIRP